MKFNIVPVFFNVGIDGQAAVADQLGLNGPQEKNNSDNFRILAEYVRKFKQKNYFNHISKSSAVKNIYSQVPNLSKIDIFKMTILTF